MKLGLRYHHGRRHTQIRRNVVSATVLALTVSSQMMPMPGASATPSNDEAHGAPQVNVTKSVSVEPVPPRKSPDDEAAAVPLDDPAWPAMTRGVAVPEGSGTAKVSGLPVWIAPSGPARERPPLVVSAAPRLAGAPGLRITLAPGDAGPVDQGRYEEATAAAPAAVAPVRVRVDVSEFSRAAGADWSKRLRFVDISDGRNVELPTDLGTRSETAETTVPGRALAGGMELVLAAGPSGTTGDYSATSLAPSASWQAGRQTGDFTWSYPFRTPPAINGPAPQLSLNYSSGSVDGRTTATNNQTSTVGEGFSNEAGYIERKFVACADDMVNTNAGQKTSDQCWRNDNASLVFGGQSTELVKDSSSGQWHLKNADGSKIEHRTAGPNDDNNGEHWILTTPDGTRHYFGKEKWESNDSKDTNSTLVTPVFGNQSGEPCHNAAFTDSQCQQAWRWNLDFVVDPHDNLLTYFYAAETNRYGSRNGAAGLNYDRAGRLVRVEYGNRLTSRASDAPSRILLNYRQRCSTTDDFDCESEPLNQANAQRWPDVPFDQICQAGTCGTNFAPTFFSQLRLANVTTQVKESDGYANVDRYDLEQSYPSPTDGTGRSLRLDSIVHSGLVGGVLVLDPVTLSYTQLENRVMGFPANQDAPPLVKYRLNSVASESGSLISVAYTPAQCSSTSHPNPSALDQNDMRCFPVWWMEEGSYEPNLHFFHKYLVKSVVHSDLGGGQPDVVTTYDYQGKPAWHYDDAELNRPKYRTWSDWRGYNHVGEQMGAGVSTSYRKYLYMRGMDGDRTAAAGTVKNVTVSGDRASNLVDHPRYNGFLREESTLLGDAAGAEVTTTVNTPWLGQSMASDGSDHARLLKNQTTQVYTPLAAGGTRQTRTHTTYDNDGLPIAIDDLGLVGRDSDDRCVRATYAKGGRILDKAAVVTHTSKSCAATGLTEADLISETVNYYDGAAQGQAPTSGDLTKIAIRKEGGQLVTKANLTYDPYGRVVSTADAEGRVETVEYQPAMGHPDTVTTFSPSPQGSTDPGARWRHVQHVNRQWGLPVAEVDLNNRRSDYEYDPLGQLTKVWSTAAPKSSGAAPVIKLDYRLDKGGQNVVATHQLRNDGSYLTSFMFYDGLLRPRQYQAPATGSQGGRLITEMEYDSRGLLTAEKGPYFNSAAPAGGLVAAVGNNTIPAITSTDYDGAARPIRSQFKSYSDVKWTTDITYGGDRTTVNPPGKAPTTTSLFDGRDQVTEKIEYLVDAPANPSSSIGARTLYDYYPDGKIRRVRDGADNPNTATVDESNEWRYAYDLRGRLMSMSDPDTGNTAFTYNDVDQVLTKTAGGKTLSYRYDNAGRQVGLFEGTTQLSAWTYDTLVKGQLTSSTRYAKDSGGSLQPYTTEVTGYDSAYRPLGSRVIIPATETNLAGTYTTTSTYNRDGSVASTALPAVGNIPPETLRYGYDAFGQLDTLNGRSSYLNDTTYSAHGEVLLRTFGTTVGKFVYDLRNYEDDTRRFSGSRVSRQGVTTPDIDTSYSYDAAGNITRIIDSGANAVDVQCFDYDHLRQLTRSWTQASTPENACAWNSNSGTGIAPYRTSYTYDNATGNRLTETRYAGNVIAATDQLIYPAATQDTVRPHSPLRVMTSGSPGSEREFTYASTGAVATDGDTALGYYRQYNWNSEQQLASVGVWGDSIGTTFVYTADGERLIKRDGTGSTLYLGHTELRATTSGTKTGTRYYHADDENIAVRTSSTVRFLAADHHGTTALQIEHSTHAVTKRRALPFGAERSAPVGGVAWTGDRGFVNGTNDTSIGTIHLGAREYDPRLGRFISADPIFDHGDSRQMNGYAYANGNPLAFSDANGLYLVGEHNNNDARPQAPTPTTFTTPAPAEVYEAVSSYAAADSAADAAEVKLKETAKELGTILADEIGVTDAIDCFRGGDAAACGGTALNVALSAVGGAALKFALKYGTHIKRGQAMVARVSDLVGDLKDNWAHWRSSLRSRDAASKELDNALDAADTAARACSFAGATTVLMADGSRKPIKDIEVGDKVIATDPETGEQVAKTVQHVFVHDDRVVDLVVDDEAITTTEDHPFWSVTDERFERADELSPGEKVLGADGRVITVSGLRLGTARETLAYNLSVEGIHTYHVGDAEILVHNQCTIPSKGNYRKLFTNAHPNMPANYQVHHALPQKYGGIMERAGVNIHDPSLLRGVDPSIHSKITTAWGRWERGLGRTPTAHDVTQFSYRIDEMYGSSFVW